ncbi:MAG: UDP-N-acetylglucosamine--N-acetylmuramyl-(pentapeptide) pyrophosphoryl-undecaprenol N-acetylglucosamine transferase [SAR86 cluster bacterium]|nr:UDP-N-acetylglucosamine--N-acetylmuramyl-(pentapeptide) pyrophosphoryl-undecaprenol N-acetylglucosamine transferase [SAR86 cluster bacterium]
MNILIAAAKTGGHIYPAVSVGSEFIDNSHNVIFLGSNNILEKNALKNQPDIQYESILMKGFRGNGLASKLLVLFNLPLNIYTLIKLIKKNNIDIVIVFGGFITIPVSLAALILRKPIYVHEQNTILGSANKISSIFSRKNFLGMPLHNNNLKKSEVVGNPIRNAFKPLLQKKYDENIHIYITGGSQGAKYLNENLPKILKDISHPIFIKHQCGSGKKEEVVRLYEGFENVEVEEFFDNPNLLIDWSDFVISRSGALSLSETMSMKKGSLMIPLPSAIDNHQFFNAKYVEEKGMGIIHEQKNGIENLKSVINLILSEKKYLVWQEIESQINHTEAAKNIVSSILKQSTS